MASPPACSASAALNPVRITGGCGYSTELDVERCIRDAPLMILGEGTNEIQRNVIAGQLVKRGGSTRDVAVELLVLSRVTRPPQPVSIGRLGHSSG